MNRSRSRHVSNLTPLPPTPNNLQEMKFNATQSYYTAEGITKLGGRLDEGEDKDLCNEWVIRGSRRCGF